MCDILKRNTVKLSEHWNHWRFPFDQNFQLENSGGEWNVQHFLVDCFTSFHQKFKMADSLHFRKWGQPWLWDIPKFSKIYPWKCLFHFVFDLDFLEVLVEWFTFQKFNSCQIFWKLFRKFLCHLLPFQNYWSYGKCIHVVIAWAFNSVTKN